jgi:hypothetical protein
MDPHRLLTKEEFHSCFAEPMRDMTSSQEPALDIWPYVDLLEPREVGVQEIGDVSFVYRDAVGRYDHVLLETDVENVVLVVVVDLAAKSIFGHHLLDLNIEYGLSTQH